MSTVIIDNIENIIEFNNVSYIYMEKTPYETRALDSINLIIEKGEFIGIIGHTGSGKTTLVQHINALLVPHDGKVVVKGIDTLEDKKMLAKMRKTVGLVFQYPEYQLFEETVIQDIGFGPKNLGLDDEEIKARVERALVKVGLDIDEVGEKSPFELSGGQKRRVAFAGVIAMEPDVLILDEPTAGLDPEGRESVLELLNTLNKDSNMTIIMISHYMDEVAKSASRVIVMDKGKIVMDDIPRKVFARYDELKSMGLDVPFTAKVGNKMSNLGINLESTPLSIDELIIEIKKLTGEDNA